VQNEEPQLISTKALLMTNEEAIMNASLDIKMIRDIINSMSDKNGQISQEQ